MQILNKSKRANVLVVGLAVFMLVGTWMVVIDNQRRTTTVQTLEKVGAQAHDGGFLQNKFLSGCSREKHKFSEGDKGCRQSLRLIQNFSSTTEAMQLMGMFNDILLADDLFDPEGTLPSRFNQDAADIGRGIAEYARVRIVANNVSCQINYTYRPMEEIGGAGESRKFEINLSCDDSSWFLENVLNNTIYLF